MQSAVQEQSTGEALFEQDMLLTEFIEKLAALAARLPAKTRIVVRPNNYVPEMVHGIHIGTWVSPEGFLENYTDEEAAQSIADGARWDKLDTPIVFIDCHGPD